MRLAFPIAILCAAVTFTSGCRNKPTTAADAASRVEAAKQIGNPGERDAALEGACKDAARLGAGDAVLNGAMAIGNPGTRDAVLAESALLLRDAHQGTAAKEAAMRIGNPGNRDDVLKKLASGS